jgi:hypothetical protein
MSQDRPGDVRSDYLKPDTSAIPDNVDGDSLFCGADSPQPDVFCGPKKLVSLRQLSLHSGAEPGLCEHALRQGWVSPDEKPGGNPCWNFGKSAMKASMKLGLIKDAAK